MKNDSLTSFSAQNHGDDFILSTNPNIPIICSVILSAIAGFTIIANTVNIPIICSVILSAIAGFTIIANTVVITALVRFGKNVGGDVTRNNGIATMLMTSLAFADGLVGVLVMPLALAELINKGKWELGQRLCVARRNLNNMLSSVSIFHIACMAIDRYMAVCKPLKYQVLTTKVGFVIIGTAWSLPVVLILMPTINGWNQRGQEDFVRVFEASKVCIRIYNKIVLSVSTVLSFYVPLAATYTLYFLIIRDIQNFSRRRNNYLKTGFIEPSGKGLPKIAEREFPEAFKISAVELTAYRTKDTRVGTDRSIENIAITTTPRSNPKLDRPHTNQNLKAYRTIGAILVCFTMCWLPLGVIVAALTVMEYTDLPFWLGLMLNWISITNFCFKPYSVLWE